MKQFLIYPITVFFLFCCKKNESQNNISFLGNWEYSSYNSKNDIQNKSFRINLYNSNKYSIIGNYCSIARNGTRIDCFNDDEQNVYGKVINDTLYVKFKSSWENSDGEAKLYFNKKSDLIWELGKTNGELYLPLKVLMKKENEE